MTHPFDPALNPALDATALATTFARTGRLSIPDFLADDAAQRLYDHLRGRDDWVQVLNSGDRLVELSRPVRAAMPDDQHLALDQAIYAAARTGFQYRFETIRVPDAVVDRARLDDPLVRFATRLSQGPLREFLRTVTGTEGIDFADAQATAYSPGDFLTGHDDAFEGKNRIAAYVLSLTPVWRTEWGGLLLFHEPDGLVGGMAPTFNTLNLFRVPQMHSVSEVTRAAAYRRYSVTGWLRTRG